MIPGLDQITWRELKDEFLRVNEVFRLFEREIAAFPDWKSRQPNI